MLVFVKIILKKTYGVPYTRNKYGISEERKGKKQVRKQKFDLDWQLKKGEPTSIPGMPSETRPVNLPHDFMIEGDVNPASKNGANTGFYDGGTVTYTKYFEIPAEWKDQRVLVSFDGVFGAAEIILNGHVMGRHHYGYTPFTVDLTKQIKYGEKNRLAVVVSNAAEQNSRWYSGAGIYRHVHLLTASKVHIAQYGIYAHTSHIVNKDAFIIVETEVENHTDEDVSCWVKLAFYEKGKKEKAAEGAVKVFLPAGGTKTARTTVCVEQAAVWDIDSPNLYEIRAQLVTRRPTDNDAFEILDEEDTSFGIRTITIDAKNGFMLNGRSVNLKGGCIHHDNGILGAASFKASEYRKAKLHKEHGYNALRFAHNPVSRDMLDACDELGLITIDEAFDTWNMPKNYYDFTQHFEAEWQQELTAFIKRDRNHPCVAIWSIGNELPEQGGLSQGYETSEKLASYVRSLDHTRPVGGALCSFFNGLDDDDTEKFWESLMKEVQMNGGVLNNLDGKFGREIWNDYTESFVAPWDVVGYNYLAYHYEEAGRLFPDRVICATESKPREMEAYWEAVEKYPYLIGDFEWTSHDYIGEAGIGKRMYVTREEAEKAGRMLHMTPYPWRTSGAGEFDLLGFEKPQLYYREIIWGSKQTHIEVYNPQNFGKIELLDRYGWSESTHSFSWPAERGVPVKVDVYSAGDEVELILNGKSCGRKPAGKANHFKTDFEIPYEPGKLEAVSFSDGIEISRDEVTTAGPADRIQLTLEEGALEADPDTLAFVRVAVTDREGNLIPFAEESICAKVTGTGVLQAFGSARPATEENYTKGETVTYQGRALAIVRSTGVSGDAILEVHSQNYGDSRIVIPF